MKIDRLLIAVTVTAIIGFMPAMALAGGHGHGHFSVGIGLGFPIYGGYGYLGGPYYYPYYYPYYPGVAYAAPPYYPPVAARPIVVNPPVVVRQETFTSYVNVTNSNGSITPVRIRQIGTVWVGPKGEQYLSYPTPEQLRPVYGF